jgi:hypothetical protein
MALGFSTSNLLDGRATGNVSGISTSAKSIRIANTTTGNTTTTNISGVTSYSATFSSLKLGVTNSLTITTYSGTGATGTVLQSLGTSTSATIGVPSVTATTSGDTSGCNWSAAAENNSVYNYFHTVLYYKIGAGSYTLYGTFSGTSGSVPSTAVTVGYSTTVTWQAQAVYSATGGIYSDYIVTNTGAATTGSAPVSPPAAPNPATGLTATDNTTNIVLNWTASAGGATGYQIARSGTVLGTTAGVTYTDNTPGAARPVTYTVTAYNTNAGGTTYGSGAAVTVPAAGGGTVLQTQQMIL